MKNERMKKITGYAALILALIALLAPGSPVQIASLGGTTFSLPARLATTSTVAVGEETIAVLFPPSPRTGAVCASRIISTATQPILIQFDNTATSSLLDGFGFLQAASTTEHYPAENFGCDDWIVKDVGGAGSTTIRISEYRQ